MDRDTLHHINQARDSLDRDQTFFDGVVIGVEAVLEAFEEGRLTPLYVSEMRDHICIYREFSVTT
jgi:hypothetical protein